MKRKFYTLLLVLTVAATSAVQAQSFSFGVKSGATVSSISNSGLLVDVLSAITGTSFSDKVKVGYTVGAFGEFKMLNRLSLSAGLGYTDLGFGVAVSGSDEKLDLSTSYLSLPIMVGCRLFGGFVIKGGLQPSVLLKAKLKADGSSESLSDIYNRAEFTVPVGIGYDFGDKFMIEALYNIGISSVMQGTGDSGIKLANRSLSLNIGYKF